VIHPLALPGGKNRLPRGQCPRNHRRCARSTLGELEIPKVIAEQTRRGHAKQPFERALFALVANRALALTPSSTATNSGSPRKSSSPATIGWS